MASGNLESAVRILLEALRRELARDDVRAAVRDVGAWLSDPDIAAPSAAPAPPATLVRPAPAVVAGPTLVPLPLQKAPLRIGDALLEVIVPGTPEEASAAARSAMHGQAVRPVAEAKSRWPAVSADQLDLASRRSALKAEAAQLLADQGSALPSALQDQFHTRLVGLGGGRLWMFEQPMPTGADFPLIARCSENFSIAARLAVRIQRRIEAEDAPPSPGALTVMAEVQSALRAAVLTAGIEDEEDQMILFSWLRVTCDVHRVFIDRFMRARQLADPHRWPAQREELGQLVEEIEGQSRRAAARKNLIGKAKFHAKKIVADAGGGHGDDWRSLDEAVTGLVAAGEAPSSHALREALLPLASVEPGAHEPGKELRLALREVAKFIEHSGESEQDDAPDDEPATAEVGEVARLLAGRTVLLVGGEVKESRRLAIERAFGLRRLHWIRANMNDASTDDFEPHIRRPETALVIRMVRFTRTHHGDLIGLCKRYGRPCVNLPRGYGVNQLASEILSQVGVQLRELPPVESPVPSAG